jgi:CheY-like chemotaxis protein
MAPSSNRPERLLFGYERSCILVVEDEFLIRLMVSDELRAAGFDVIEACDGDEAVTVLNSLARVDLIFSDVRMPGSLDGLELLTFVKATFPALPVIIASGHIDPRIARASGASDFLAKPYLLGTVLTAVRDALDGCREG